MNYLPVGSEQAARHYAQAAIDAGRRVRELHAGVHRLRPARGRGGSPTPALPIVGDDIKSQVGATIVHRVLAKLFEDRGVKLERHLPAELRRQHGLHEHAGARAAGSPRRSPRRSRSRASCARTCRKDTSTSGRPTTCRGSQDRKWAQIRLEGTGVRRRSDVRRAEARGVGLAELGRHRDRRHPLRAGWPWTAAWRARSSGPSAYFMKSPPVQFSDDAAREMVEEFILGNGASQAGRLVGVLRRRRPPATERPGRESARWRRRAGLLPWRERRAGQGRPAFRATSGLLAARLLSQFADGVFQAFLIDQLVFLLPGRTGHGRRRGQGLRRRWSSRSRSSGRSPAC